MTDRLAYTRKEAAELCGVSIDTIARAKNRGDLRAVRLTNDEDRKGGKELYTLKALQDWLDSLPAA